MSNTEIKIEFKNKEILSELIQKSYFENNSMGRLSGQKNYIPVTKEVDNVLHTVVRGMNNLTVKLTNPEIISGSFRVIVSEDSEGIKIFPVNNFCIMEENRYSFY